MILELQRGIVYGPVSSRRLGRSLGINVLPPGRKVCTLDCLYCQYGWNRPVSPGEKVPAAFPGAAEVLGAIELALAGMPQPPAYLTFSGNGEASLHPELAALVEGVGRLRDQYCPSARTAILSNATAVVRADVRNALAGLDMRIMKLDAGTEEMFQAYNRPAPGVTLEDVTSGLARLAGITIQTLLAGGPHGNAGPAHLAVWADRLRRLRPLSVQLYSLSRPCPQTGLIPLGQAEMARARELLRQAGIPAIIY